MSYLLHRIGPVLLWVPFVLLPTTTSGAIDVLMEARKLATNDFKNWTYGSDPQHKQIDCVQFVLAVVKRVNGGTVDASAASKILISDLGTLSKQTLAALIVSEDKRTKGVQQALVEMNHGTVVNPDDTKPGDFIQYWMEQTSGDWFGHSGIISEVTNGSTGKPEGVRILSSHKSQNRVGDSDFSLKLKGDKRKIYIVRYK